MPRPTHKEALLQAAHDKWVALNRLIDALPDVDKNREFPAGTMNRNIRDVLGHLHAWHLLMLDWYETGMQHQKPDMPAKGYTWKTTPELNRKIWEENRQIDLLEIRKKLEQSHRDVCGLILTHSNEALFEKKKYKWTGSTSLGAYLVSATSSHYDWAIKLIKKALG